MPTGILYSGVKIDDSLFRLVFRLALMALRNSKRCNNEIAIPFIKVQKPLMKNKYSHSE